MSWSFSSLIKSKILNKYDLNVRLHVLKMFKYIYKFFSAPLKFPTINTATQRKPLFLFLISFYFSSGFIVFPLLSFACVHPASHVSSSALTAQYPGPQRGRVMKWPLAAWICFLPSFIWLWGGILLLGAQSEGQNPITSNNDHTLTHWQIGVHGFVLCVWWSERANTDKSSRKGRVQTWHRIFDIIIPSLII